MKESEIKISISQTDNEIKEMFKDFVLVNTDET